MKTAKKLFAALLAVVMVMALVTVPALAASDFIITVNGAQTDGTYSAYKVFETTVDTDNDAVFYTIPSGSTISSISGFSDVFTVVTRDGTSYVTQKDGVTNDAVIKWLTDNKTSIATGTPAATGTTAPGATSVVLDVGAAGYYLITSTVGTKSAVEVTTAKPTATINDKTETTPTIDPNGGKKVGGKLVNDMQVGAKETFTVTFTATNYATVKGDDGKTTPTPINSYTVTDTPDGFTIDSSTVKVTVNDTEYNIAGKTVNASVDSTTGVLTVTIPWDQTTYASPSTVVVTYDATLTNKNQASASTNKATIKYNETTIPGTPETKTYSYNVKVTKVDAENQETKLDGAKFVLKNNEGKFYSVADNGVVSWVDDQANATEVTTDTNGEASFTGLASGTYTLVETKAPAGYNLAADEEFTLEKIIEEVADNATLTKGITVQDKKGATLPETGGIGTTIFYVLGGVLVVAAIVLLVTRKRMREE